MTLVSSKEFICKQYSKQPILDEMPKERYQCADWYGITDIEDSEEGIYTREEVIEHAIEALIEHHEIQIFKNRPKTNT